MVWHCSAPYPELSPELRTPAHSCSSHAPGAAPIALPPPHKGSCHGRLISAPIRLTFSSYDNPASSQCSSSFSPKNSKKLPVVITCGCSAAKGQTSNNLCYPHGTGKARGIAGRLLVKALVVGNVNAPLCISGVGKDQDCGAFPVHLKWDVCRVQTVRKEAHNRCVYSSRPVCHCSTNKACIRRSRGQAESSFQS